MNLILYTLSFAKLFSFLIQHNIQQGILISALDFSYIINMLALKTSI